MKICNPLFLLILTIWSCSKPTFLPEINTNDLEIKKISDNSYLHISYLETKTWGKVACNGAIYINNGKAFIFDTPVNDKVSKQLINHLKQGNIDIKGIVINHFHEDCLGGLAAFHASGIRSYASNKTIKLAEENNLIIPQNGFDRVLKLKIGNSEVINLYCGEAHTKDNIVSYLKKDEVLFGGCMVKELNAGKGNLADANIGNWSETIQNVKKAFPNAKVVIPGHGKTGGQELLDYTINLFK